MTERSWNESDSQIFIDQGKIFTPRRDELLEAFLDLIPAELDESFQVVELAPRAGWLSAGILERFPHASILALDGSEEMLAETARALASYPGRWETRSFQLLERDWRAQLPNDLRAIVSSLAIHHLERNRQARSLRRSARPPHPRRRAADRRSGRTRQSRRPAPHGPRLGRRCRAPVHELSGSPAAWEYFRDDHWNIYTWPDLEMDFPSPLVDQIDWLRQTGYTRIDIPWARAGHTLIAAYRS